MMIIAIVMMIIAIVMIIIAIVIGDDNCYCYW